MINSRGNQHPPLDRITRITPNRCTLIGPAAGTLDVCYARVDGTARAFGTDLAVDTPANEGVITVPNMTAGKPIRSRVILAG
jgi:hypothetical protein